MDRKDCDYVFNYGCSELFCRGCQIPHPPPTLKTFNSEVHPTPFQPPKVYIPQTKPCASHCVYRCTQYKKIVLKIRLNF